MQDAVFENHERLKGCAPALLVYILYRRLVEQGVRPTWLWLTDKLVRRMRGFSPPAISQVAPKVYVGGQHSHHGLAAMRALGIDAVLNMREESDDAARGVALDAYLWLPTTDDAAPTLEDLEQGALFIEEQVAAGRGVYVHCASGVGRAPTMAAAYLVRGGATPEEAWRAILAGRPFVRPTPPQVEIIQAFAHRRAAARASQGPAESGVPDISEVKPKERATPVTPAFGSSNPGIDPNDRDRSVERRIQIAYERIAEDSALTGDLTDAPAQQLLTWAREEVVRLVHTTAAMDETEAWQTLDPKLAELRRYLRWIAQEASQEASPEAALRTRLGRPDNVKS